MWGEVTPAERLRSVTRRNVDDDRLAAAAADALAGFADEPASLVVACRRVLAHHRAHGALWWVCSRILAAADPEAAAHTAVARARESIAPANGSARHSRCSTRARWSPSSATRRRSTMRCSSGSTSTRSQSGSTATIRSSSLRRRRSDHAVRVVDGWDPGARAHVAIGGLGDRDRPGACARARRCR